MQIKRKLLIVFVVLFAVLTQPALALERLDKQFEEIDRIYKKDNSNTERETVERDEIIKENKILKYIKQNYKGIEGETAKEKYENTLKSYEKTMEFGPAYAFCFLIFSAITFYLIKEIKKINVLIFYQPDFSDVLVTYVPISLITIVNLGFLTGTAKWVYWLFIA